MDHFVDGNALAGSLWQVFRPDVTAAQARCASCGTVRPVADLRVYTAAPGAVARCANCDQVTLQLVQSPDALWLSTSGLSYLRFNGPLE